MYDSRRADRTQKRTGTQHVNKQGGRDVFRSARHQNTKTSLSLSPSNVNSLEKVREGPTCASVSTVGVQNKRCSYRTAG